MLDLTNKTIAELIDPKGFDCECGQRHAVSIRYIKTGRGVVSCVPEMLEALGAKKPFVLCDQSTYKAAGEKVCEVLKAAGIPVVINASMIPENAEDMEKIIELGRSLDLNTRVSTYMFPPVRRDRETGDSRFTPEQAAEMFMRRSQAYFSAENLEQMLRKERESRSPDDWGVIDEHMRCRAGRCSFWVSWEGKMTACGLLPFPLECNPFIEPFAECWPRLTDCVRCATVLEKCKDCKLREICNPCAATVYAECGDVNGKAEYLCQTAEHIEEKILAFLEERSHETKS